MKPTKLPASIAGIASKSPAEALGPDSRYVVLADLRLGDGRGNDESIKRKRALFDILGSWYLPRGYTLVLDGDIEDLRRFWLKDILAAWAELYAVFDAFREKGRLRKIAGERDLALLRLRSYPYEINHALRLDGKSRSILILHGHQASEPYVGRDYVSDYMVHWLGSGAQPPARPKAPAEDAKTRFRVERRLYRAGCELGMMIVEGHARRPLFESRTNRDSVRAEVERLLREGDPGRDPTKIDRLLAIYRREERRNPKRRAPSGSAYDQRSLVVPCLFSPGSAWAGSVGGGRTLRMLEIDGDTVSLARWAKADRWGDFPRKAMSRGALGGAPGASLDFEGPESLDGTLYSRCRPRRASIDELFERIALLCSHEAKGDLS